MVDAGLANVFRREGIELIPLQAGADYLVNEIATPGPAETVILAQAPGGNVLAAASAAGPDHTVSSAPARHLLHRHHRRKPSRRRQRKPA